MQAGTLTNFDIADDSAVHLDLEPEKSRITDGNNLSSFSRLEPKLKSNTNTDIDQNKYELSALRADLKDERPTSNVQHRILNKEFYQFIN